MITVTLYVKILNIIQNVLCVQVLKLPSIIGAACNLALCSRPRFCLEYFRNKIDPALHCVRNNKNDYKSQIIKIKMFLIFL